MTTSVQRARRIDTSFVGDRVVLYARDAQKALVLNPTGAWLWKLLGSPQQTSQLVEKLAENHPLIEPQRVAADVAEYVRELVQHGVVVES